jgi:hypothetical protein
MELKKVDFRGTKQKSVDLGSKVFIFILFFTKNRINCGKKQQVLRDDFNTQKFRSYKSFLI